MAAARALLLAAASSASLAAAGNRGAPLKQQWPWYRSGDELHSAIQELTEKCGAEASLSTSSRVNSAEAAGEEVRLDVLRVRGRAGGGGNATAPRARIKAMLVFGEHARELITGELALGFARALCGSGPAAERAAAVLNAVEFVLVPNANPLSRRKVESGYYCKRTNEDGVDLNRNWSDEHRDQSRVEGDEMYPGPGGFSEPETQLLGELVESERPDVYLSVHSGAFLLGTPFGYDGGRVPTDEAAMLEVLRPISEKYCAGGCPYGNLARLIHYNNPGCDIDYVYSKLNTPYVFTWEVYVGEVFRGRYEMEARMQRGVASLAQQQRRSRLRARRGAGSHRSVRAATRARKAKATAAAVAPEAEEDIGSCMDQFNPQTEEETGAVVENWTGAFLELCEEVVARRGSGAAGAGGGGGGGLAAAAPPE